MGSILSAFDAGKALIDKGLVPAENCSKVTIDFEPMGVVRMTTQIHMTPEQFFSMIDVILAAKDAGNLVERHERVNAETGQVLVPDEDSEAAIKAAKL